MFKLVLVIPIVLGLSYRVADTLKVFNSPGNIANIEAMRVAKSESIHKYMNESVDPCEDFYQFACGNWHTHHPATEKRRQTHGLYFARDDYDRILSPLLNETDAMYTESEWKVKNFYDSCLNFSTLKLSAYRQNMKKLISEFGRMPVLEGKKWQATKFDWIKTVGEINYKYNIGIIYGYTFRGADDPTAIELIMESQLLYEFEEDTAEAKNKQKSDVEKKLKHFIGIETKTAKTVAKEIADFGVKLWTAYRNSGKRRETTLAEMHQKYSSRLDIMKLIKISFGSIPGGVVIDENPGYVEALATIMRKTPKHVVANYIFYALMHNFETNRMKIKKDSSVVVDCLQTTKLHFSAISSNMAYRRSHLNETEQEFRRMWQGITATLQNTLESNQLSWFDDASREAALEKLHVMSLFIASFADVEFDELFKDLTLNSSDFMENEKALKSFTAQDMRKALNERRDDAFGGIGDCTPSYMSTANVVRFPLSSLLTDFMWSKYAPHATNYARLGSITAHEIMHGFSGSGRNFNKLGFLIDWIFNDIEESYEERRQCYYNQYHNFTLDAYTQDQSQAENVADNGGLYLAYHAYLRWLGDEARTQAELDMETLPHLNYTNKQVFFIGFSQLHCSDDYPDETLSEMIKNDVHSPNKLRAFVPLLNFGEFAKEFNCPLGSPMNPRKKCSIY